MKRLVSHQALSPTISSNVPTGGPEETRPYTLQALYDPSRNDETRGWLTVTAVGIVFALYLTAASANPTNPCGTFAFSGVPDNNSGEKIVEDFHFAPAKCNSNCHCGTICYIQIMRAIDLSNGEPRQPSTQQYDRMVTGQPDALLNYWAVDRVDSGIWGYYGRNNNGDFSSNLQPGNNSRPAVLKDEPSNWDPNIQFEAIDVPVCIDDASACRDELLGCYYYRFTVQANGSTNVPSNQIGANWNAQAVGLAIRAWNVVAGGLNKKPFPCFTWMPR